MKLREIKRDFKLNKTVYLMIAPIIIFLVIFNYLPMGGILMAFQKYKPGTGMFGFGSEWVGFKHFVDFFNSIYFFRILRNTFLLSFFDLLAGFPAPIIFALLLNEVRNRKFKKTVQTISYMPYFISTVIICGIIADFTNSTGLVAQIVSFFGGTPRNYLARPEYFRTIFVTSNIWQSIGFSSIIYLATLSNIDQELYDAAVVDGAGRLRQTWHVTLPGLASTIIILLILRMGSLLSVGFEKIILLYSPGTYETADVISSFVYRKGLVEFNYSFSTAVGLFNSAVALILVAISNTISKRFTETSLF